MKWIFAFSLSLLFIWGLSYAQDFEEIQSQDIVVKFEKHGDSWQIQRFRRNALPTIESLVSEISRDLGASSQSSKLRIQFYSGETFGKRFPSIIGKNIPAFYRKGQGVFARFDNELTERLESTLRHEVTHYVLSESYGSLPSWVDEGLAKYMERKNTRDPRPTFPEYNTLVVEDQKGGLLSLSQLESDSYFSRGHGTVHASQAYVIAFIAIDELIHRHGMHAVKRFLEDVGGGKSPSNVFMKSFGTSYEDFNQELLKTAKKKAAA